MSATQPIIKAGRIELRQVKPDAEITLSHRAKSGTVVVIKIQASQLERWAVRQLRQEAFA